MIASPTTVLVNLIFEDHTFHKSVSNFEALAIYAAVSVAPETLSDLEQGLKRYCSTQRAAEICQEWRTELRERKQGAIMILDFTARLAAGKQLPFEWDVAWLRYDEDSETRCTFSWSDDWTICEDDEYSAWKNTAHSLRQALAKTRSLPTRTVMYDRFLEFALEKAQAAGEDFDVRDTHKTWLTTRRKDLLNQTPRHWLSQEFYHRQMDALCQESYWIYSGECPPEIEVEAHAYRYALYGPNEYALYFEMCHHLLSWLAELPSKERRRTTLESMFQKRDQWLSTPFDGFAPNWIIHQERKRLPILDEQFPNSHDDCLLCHTLGARGLDFYTPRCPNLSCEYEFTPCQSREAWENEFKELYLLEEERNANLQSDQPAWTLGETTIQNVVPGVDLEDTILENEKVEVIDDRAEVIERTCLQAPETVPGEKPPIAIGPFDSERTWQHSSLNREAMRRLPPQQYLYVLMHGVIFCFAELAENIKDISCLANSAAGLLTGAENLNEAVRSSAHWSVKSIVRALQEELADIGVSVTDSPMFPQLVAKCNDLHGLLGELEAASAALDPDSQDLAPELKEIEAESQTRAAEPQIGLESGDKELPA